MKKEDNNKIIKTLKPLLITFGLFCFGTAIVHAQNISVKSFHLLENDMNARINFPKKDQNGEQCAIIKVITIELEFSFDGDGLGIVSIERKTGEYFLYVPNEAKRLTIIHSKIGFRMNYTYPVPIEKANVYELVLTTKSY